MVLGSTGSIGTQALDVIRGHRDDYQVVALAAGRNTELLAGAGGGVRRPAGAARSCADDPDALAELAAHPDADVVLNAVVGFAGLPATIAALEHGKRLALANKESLIAGGPGRRRGAGPRRRRDRARRLRALRDLPVPARRPPGRGPPAAS